MDKSLRTYLKKWFEIYNHSDLNDEIKKISNVRYANTYIYISLFVVNTNSVDKEKLCKDISNDFEIMKNCKGFKYRTIYYLYKICGLKTSFKILKLIRKQLQQLFLNKMIKSLS